MWDPSTHWAIQEASCDTILYIGQATYETRISADVGEQNFHETGRSKFAIKQQEVRDPLASKLICDWELAVARYFLGDQACETVKNHTRNYKYWAGDLGPQNGVPRSVELADGKQSSGKRRNGEHRKGRWKGDDEEKTPARKCPAGTSRQTFLVSDFTAASVDTPIQAIIARPSTDVAGPFADKRARQETAAAAARASIPSPDFGQESDRYDIHLGDDDDAPDMMDLDTELPGPGKRSRKVQPADPVLAHFMTYLRDQYLREFLRREGRADAEIGVCCRCDNRGMEHECCVDMHVQDPLHNIEKWEGNSFEKVWLKDLGLRIQLGHPTRKRCYNPVPAHKDFVVLHANGIHLVNVDFCACAEALDHGEHHIQLLRRNWFPSSDVRPRTCATFELLDSFMMQTLQAKTTMYDFYGALEKLTDNTWGGASQPVSSFYADVSRVQTLSPPQTEGSCAQSPRRDGDSSGGCPNPEVNLPKGWETANEEDRKLYILFLALDACFCLKRQMVSSELRDPGLGTGWAYLVENGPYRSVPALGDEAEGVVWPRLTMPTQSFSRGYSSTGVGMGVCARHEFVQANGVGDLQLGERYVNMDYIFASILRHKDNRLSMVISYDIVCQWWKHLIERLQKLPLLVRITITAMLVRFVIPKMHIHAHTLACQLVFSLNLLLGAAQTDGEGIERPWANIGGVASSTRVMGLGAWHDCLDCHWSWWNWQKFVGIVALLRKRHDIAVAEQRTQEDELARFTAEQGEKVTAWREQTGLNEAQVRLQFNEEEARQAKAGVIPLHNVSPSSFLASGLELEDQQQSRTCPGGAEEGSDDQANKLILAPCSDVLLFLPSGLSVVERKAPGLLIYKKNHSRHQGATTKSRSLVARNESKIRLHSEKYQAAWAAQVSLAGGEESEVGWRKLKKADIRCMEDAEEVSKDAQRKRDRAARRLAARTSMADEWRRTGDQQGPAAGLGAENRRTVSWIWMGAGMTGTDADLEEALRIEWCKTYAQTRCWREQVRLLEEEYRRVLVSYEYEVLRWEARLKSVNVGSTREEVIWAEGVMAYGLRQARMYRLLAARGEVTWTEAKLVRGKRCAAAIMRLPGLVEVLENESSDGEEGDGLGGDEEGEPGMDGEEDWGDGLSEKEGFELDGGMEEEEEDRYAAHVLRSNQHASRGSSTAAGPGRAGWMADGKMGREAVIRCFPEARSLRAACAFQASPYALRGSPTTAGPGRAGRPKAGWGGRRRQFGVFARCAAAAELVHSMPAPTHPEESLPPLERGPQAKVRAEYGRLQVEGGERQVVFCGGVQEPHRQRTAGPTHTHRGEAPRPLAPRARAILHLQDGRRRERAGCGKFRVGSGPTHTHPGDAPSLCTSHTPHAGRRTAGGGRQAVGIWCFSEAGSCGAACALRANRDTSCSVPTATRPSPPPHIGRAGRPTVGWGGRRQQIGFCGRAQLPGQPIRIAVMPHRRSRRVHGPYYARRTAEGGKGREGGNCHFGRQRAACSARRRSETWKGSRRFPPCSLPAGSGGWKMKFSCGDRLCGVEEEEAGEGAFGALFFVYRIWVAGNQSRTSIGARLRTVNTEAFGLFGWPR
ncbi:hypothetical protein DFH07DRAFT_764466 [Mycena maculata]|uniref:CxC2-like cysteine cluster KDZ transposase-associated domain-containing protein n=1 Tax=Mycena maculata TaxID=230809 RepID=A0AAD7KD35_9AGAR|nr:hypothetical protein DFH07DRAFT_764466 [Mycena maculata]